MRIRTGPDFQIQCKWQNPDCAVRIAVKRLLNSLSYVRIQIMCLAVTKIMLLVVTK